MRWMAAGHTRRNGRVAGFDHIHADLVEHTCNFDLFVDRKIDIRRLFAFAQGGIQDFNHGKNSFFKNKKNALSDSGERVGNRNSTKASAYVFPINQRRPTIPTTENPDVGRRLALASKTNAGFILLILGRFIHLYMGNVNKYSLKVFKNGDDTSTRIFMIWRCK